MSGVSGPCGVCGRSFSEPYATEPLRWDTEVRCPVCLAHFHLLCTDVRTERALHAMGDYTAGWRCGRCLLPNLTQVFPTKRMVPGPDDRPPVARDAQEEEMPVFPTKRMVPKIEIE